MNPHSRSGRCLLVGLSLLALGSCADAADMPVKAPPIQPRFDWTGFYVGGHLGYARGHASGSFADPVPATSSNSFGSLFGGFQLGYNYVLPSGFLVGVEGDVSFPNFLGADDVARSRFTAQGILEEKIDYIGRLRGRFGYVSGNWLVYGTGGFAWS